MQKKIARNLLLMLLVLVMVLSVFPIGAMAANGTISGSGTTEEDPFLIEDKADLTAFAANVEAGENYAGKFIKLTADITDGFDARIGTTLPKAFAGTFDGGGYTIDVNIVGASRLGLFGNVTGTIRNLTVSGSVYSNSGGLYSGGVVGYLSGGSVLNCGNTAKVYGNTGKSGGVVGYAEKASIIDGCYNTGEISGGSRLGGVLGELYDSKTTASNCYNLGDIVGTSSAAGGVVGYASSTVTNCYNANNTITGASTKGAVIGYKYSSGSMVNCFYEENGDLQGDSAGNPGATSLTTVNMKAAAGQLGDFFMPDTDNINEGYPILYWQGGGEDPEVVIPEALDALVAKHANDIAVYENADRTTPYANRSSISAGSVYLDDYILADSDLGTATADVYAIWESSVPSTVTVPDGGYGTATVTHSTTAATSVKLKAYLTAVVGETTYRSTAYVEYSFTITQDVGEITSVTVYVSVFNTDRNSPIVTGADGRPIVAVPVTVTAPINTICLSNALEQLHKDYYDGTDGYVISSSGLVSKLWGIENDNAFSFYRNDALTDVVTQESIADGDMITAFAYLNTSIWNDRYIYFDSPRISITAGGSAVLPAYYRTYDNSIGISVSPSATVYKMNEDGSTLTASSDITYSNGTVSASTAALGKYVLVGIQTSDTGVRYIPAVCLVEVGPITDADAVAADKAALTLDGTAVSDLHLPATGENGSAITWSSSDENTINSTTGVVNRLTEADATVTLTATIEKGDCSDTKTFTITVPKLPGDEEGQEAAEAVIHLIDAIGEVTKDSGDAINAARNAYDKLTDAQRKLVSNYNKLEAAEAKFAELKNEPVVDIKTMTDIPANAWYYQNVAYVLAKGIMKGDSPTTFNPEGKITRGQFVTILGRYAGIEDGSAANPTTTPFGDVKTNAYYAPHVAWAAAQGITLGTTSATFEPERTISRQDMATMIVRFAKVVKISLPDGANAPAFADDASIAAYAKAAVYSMVEAGIIDGVGNNRFDPRATATRSQAAKIIHLLLEL